MKQLVHNITISVFEKKTERLKEIEDIFNNLLLIDFNKEKVSRLQHKALWYYLKARDIWEEMLHNLSLSSEEKENIESNLSIVEENLKENVLRLNRKIKESLKEKI